MDQHLALKSNWALSRREDGTAQIYATSLGPMRMVVPIAETTIEFGEYIISLHDKERKHPNQKGGEDE